MASFEERLRQLRKEKGLSQAELAAKLHVINTTVSIWERGVRKPEMGTMDRICEFFDVSLAYLLGTIDDRQSSTDSEDRVAYRESVHDQQVNNMIIYSELSDESKATVEGVIRALYEADKTRGTLVEPVDGLKEELENLFHMDFLK